MAHGSQASGKPNGRGSMTAAAITGSSSSMGIFDLNIAATECELEQQQNEDSRSQLLFEQEGAALVDRSTSQNTESTMLCANATGETLPSEDSDDEDEIQSQEVSCTPQDPFALSTTVYDSWQQARSCYNKYAKKVGFSMKIGGSKKKEKEGEKNKVMFVCNKNGSNQENSEGPVAKQRNRNKTEKTGCTARMTVSKRGEKWHVTTFHEDHNHPVCMKFELKKYLRSHKGIPDEEKRFIELLHGSNVSAGRMMQIFADISGGHQFTMFNTKDISNYKAKLGGGTKYKDMAETFQYFEELKKQDPNFYCKFELDSKDRVRNLFWVDGAARAAYKEFGDCISFDTTYMTNRYRMPFAPFIGINNHGQSIQLGCGFMKDETIESFTWLFTMFLDAMGGVAPATIITDQDQAMTVAISNVFPDTVHRNCRWHIVNKVQGPLAPYLKKKPGMDKELNECMDYSISGSEYESTWTAIIEKYSAADNKHLQYLYELRKLYVPAYYMHSFFPFIQSTARSEGFNAVLKRYVNPQMSILNFVQQYLKIQEKITSKEHENEFTSEEKIPSELFTEYPFEEQVSKFYTRALYYKFQHELKKSTSYKITDVSGYNYTLTPVKGFVLGCGRRDYKVFADVASKSYMCECSKIERDGLLCCHILKIMTQVYIDEIPSAYLLRRWSNQENAAPLHGSVDEAEKGNDEQTVAEGANPKQQQSLKTIRYATLSSEFAKIAKDACTNEKTTQILRDHMKEMRADVAAFRAKNSKRQKTTQNGEVAENAAMDVNDPPASKPKGRPISTRIKPGFNLQAKPNNMRCKICGSNEHTASKCLSKLGKK